MYAWFHKYLVQADVRIRCGQRQARVGRVLRPEHIDVARVQDRLHGSPPDAAAAQPHQRAQPHRQLVGVERIAGSDGVEITRQDMEPIAMLLDAAKRLGPVP